MSSDRFKVVWTVLNALRTHDDRFDATINKIKLNRKVPDKIRVVGIDIDGTYTMDDESDAGKGCKMKCEIERQLELKFTKLQGQIYAKIVQKCETKPYWEQWAANVVKIAERHIEQISTIVGRE